MAQVSFPDPGHDGEQPLPGGPARDAAEDDYDMDASMARFLADIDEGREEIPEPWQSPACTVSLGEACDVDLAELAAMAGPDGAAADGFAQDQIADTMRPGPVLAALTEQAAENLSALTDDNLLGAASAARRLAARAEYLELKAVAEFGRRRQEACDAAKARGDRPGRRDGEFAGDELAREQVSSDDAAYDKLAFAAALTTRLPETFAGLGAGRLDRYRVVLIHRYTQFLSDAACAEADKILAAAAPALTYAALRQKATRLECKLDPEGVKRRKEEAAIRHRRVEARREDSGNMSYGGRELAVEEALAAKATIDADAVALRNSGVEGSLRDLRVLAYLARLQGKNPLDRAQAAGPRPAQDQAESDGRRDDGRWDDDNDDDEGRPGGGAGGSGFGPKGPGTPSGGLAPLPALINLIVPAGTLFDWSNAPGELGTWGLTDPDDTRRIVEAASQHPGSRWCVTVTGADGTAVAHGCARGQHPWTSALGARDGPTARGPDEQRRGPDAQQAAQLAELLRRLNVVLAPIAKGHCDHRHQENRYIPSRKLKHLVRARTARCSSPGCGAQAVNCDIDHSAPYPSGITCECALGPLCRHHHRVKQAPGWKLEELEPGIMRWTTPSGRTYTTTPTVYDA